VAAGGAVRDDDGMTRTDRARVARLVLVERRDTPAAPDPAVARVRRYRLARAQLPAGDMPDVAAREARDVAARFRPRET
jgi:hypothetical protein